MISKIELRITSENIITDRISPYLHGFLLTNIDSEYSQYLHEAQLNPFTQYLTKREDSWYWIITTLDQNTYKNIIEDYLMKVDTINLKHDNMILKITNKKIEIIENSTLLDILYDEDQDKYMELEFLTTSTFKKDGKFLIYPDLECMFKSIMNKYNSANNIDDGIDEDLLSSLLNETTIVEYNLRTKKFSVGTSYIKGFIGKIKIKTSNKISLRNYTKFLLKFSEFCGIGAKTSMGMGATKINERRKKVDN